MQHIYYYGGDIVEKKYTVYMHISPSNKRYIGITSMKYASSRWAGGKGYKDNKYFTSAIQKYGWKKIQHIIIAKGLTEDEAKWLEIQLIKLLKTTDRKKGYNITKGGESASGFVGMKGENNPSKRAEVREKISLSHRGNKNPMFGKKHSNLTKEKMSLNNAKKRKIYCKELDKTFESLADTNEYLGKNRNSDNIGQCARGKTKTAYGLHWEYKEVSE